MKATMRQNNDVPRTQRLLNAVKDMLAGEADPTLVNGALIDADWEEAEANRVQTYLAQSEWEKPVYNVTFADRTVLDPPYSLAAGSELVWQTTGWRGVCRRVTPDTDNDTVIDVVALVVLVSE